MKISDVTKRLKAPFPAHMIQWKPGVISKDRKRALMLAHIDARAVQDRLDAICPDAWAFDVEQVVGARVPTVKGTLTVLGVSRSDIGEASEGDLGTFKAAASDALKRCGVHFGIGRYLYDLPKCWSGWDDAKRQPVSTPELPEWARPDHERTPGGAHLAQAIEQLKYEAGQCDDIDLQREVYRHLKAALATLHPTAQTKGRESETEGNSRPGMNGVVGGISQATRRQLAAHLEGPRWGFVNREQRVAFTAWLASLARPISSSGELTEQEGLDVLRIVERCPEPEAKVAEWHAELGNRVA